MIGTTRLALVALALVLASPALATNDTVVVNGLPLFVMAAQTGSILPVAVYNSSAVPLSVAGGGTTGKDYSANQPTLPNVGANFAASGPYASYYLIATVTAAQQKSLVQVWNTSGAQIAIIRDDGTAAAAAAPTNATVFSLAGGSGVGAQGGSYADANFKGRLQIYAPSSTAQVAVSVE